MSLTIRTDVTAVKLYKNYVFAGIGGYIHIFDKQTLKLLQKIECLIGQRIYGFVESKCGEKILVFGGKQFTVITEGPAESGPYSRSFEPILCNDWSHSGVWIGEDTVALLSAHNVVQKWDTSSQVFLSQYKCVDNSILYCGLVIPSQDDLIVLAGTVFSEIIIHRCGEQKPLHRLTGHRGILFSISCDPQKGIIVSTSDDRSLRIWSMNNIANHPNNSKEFWDNITIECKHEVYGHTARVMRSSITNDLIISVGEDAAICFWNYEGTLLRKLSSHQTASIWSIDVDDQHVVTGGGDCGVNIHPLTVVSDYGQKEVLDIPGTPKKLVVTARNNIVVLNEDNELIYYDTASKFMMKYTLYNKSAYKLLCISTCKQIIAVADMLGKLNVFIENCKGTAHLQNIIDTTLQVGMIMSMHWAGNRYLCVCAKGGKITVLVAKGNEAEVYATFMLPNCREKWLTSCAADPDNKFIVCGDRNGHVHCFVIGERNPIKTFKKVHGNYGPTSIMVRNNQIVTTGRDGSVRYFSVEEDVAQNKYLSCKDLEFDWVERFLDKDETLICGFHERMFVVYNLKTNMKVLDLVCGGGHRIWDVARYFKKVNGEFEEFITMVYFKISNFHSVTYQISKLVSKSVVNGSHGKEINCLITYISEMDRSKTYYITGGEDTTLRISSIDSELRFQDEIIYKHLSNVRTVKMYPLNDNEILVISAGGRAQICINMFRFDKIDGAIKVSTQELAVYLLKGTDEERKRNKMLRFDSVDFDPETRIMDLVAIKVNDNKFIIIAGCSDSFLRLFVFINDGKEELFNPMSIFDFHETCILKIQHIKCHDEDFIATCSTRGEIIFSHIVNVDEQFKIEPKYTLKNRNCGINCFAYRSLSNTDILIGTGGDDNAISLNLIQIKEDLKIEELCSWSSNRFHCSQVTGLNFIDDMMISTSIDQQVTLLRWRVDKDGIECEFLTQTYSNVADIQGLELLEYTSGKVTVCVFGIGLEVITIDIPTT